jgi:hypothetical protein
VNSLDATFTLTPGTPYYSDALNNSAYIACYGADFTSNSTANFVTLYSSNRLYFDGNFAADPGLDYTQWANRKKARWLNCYIGLQSYAGLFKQLALIFGFDRSIGPGAALPRLLVYSDAGLLQDQTFYSGDNQFLLVIQSLDLPLSLYFIHVGGPWFFRGISGYVV